MLFGMSKRDLNTLKKIMHTPRPAELPKTVQQAIDDGTAEIINRRTSKRGTELLTLSNGKEYDAANIDRTIYR